MRLLAVVSCSSRNFPNFYARSVTPVLGLAKQRGHDCLIVSDEPYLQSSCPVVQVREQGFKDRFRCAISAMPDALRLEPKLLSMYIRLRNELDPIYREHIFLSAYYFAMRRFYEYQIGRVAAVFNPDLIAIIPDQGMIGRAGCMVARKRRVSSVTWHTALLSAHISYDVPVADYVIFGGEAIAETFIKSGLSRDQVFIVGHVFLDAIKHTDKHGEAVLFATENFAPEATKHFLKKTVTECKRTGKKLVLKVHPREQPSMYTPLVQDVPHEIYGYLPSNSDILEESRFVVLDQSTFGIEALASGCHLISYDGGREKFIDYAGEGAASVFQENFTESPAVHGASQFLKRWNNGPSGHATERTVEVLERICRRN